jgi:hypothetical protein
MPNDLARAPWGLAIELHYKRLNLQDKWNERRIKRLCGFLRITIEELAAILGINEKTFFNQLASRRIYMSACILLTILEHQAIGGYVDDTIPDVLSGALKRHGRPRNT